MRSREAAKNGHYNHLTGHFLAPGVPQGRVLGPVMDDRLTTIGGFLSQLYIVVDDIKRQLRTNGTTFNIEIFKQSFNLKIFECIQKCNEQK